MPAGAYLERGSIDAQKTSSSVVPSPQSTLRAPDSRRVNLILFGSRIFRTVSMSNPPLSVADSKDPGHVFLCLDQVVEYSLFLHKFLVRAFLGDAAVVDDQEEVAVAES